MQLPHILLEIFISMGTNFLGFLGEVYKLESSGNVQCNE